MVTTPLKINSVEDVIRYIPDNDFEYYSRLDKQEIRNGSVCKCKKGRFLESGDKSLYEGDKQGVAICTDCEGYYGIVIPNWY